MVVIDLFAQRHAVAVQLRRLEDSDKLKWLREHGELTKIPMTEPFPTAYEFRSLSGIETCFVIRDGKMIFIGDHTTIGVVQIDN